MAERRLGPFVLTAELGRGGMGVVHRAIYTKNGREVALKVLPAELSKDEKLSARFERELEILKKLRHKNIVHYLGSGKIANQQFYAMEIVEGGSLAGLLKERGKFTWQETIRYAMQICEALDCAHEQGIIHRDLKPANLMLATDGTLKLADFGIARDLGATALTADGRTVGTCEYMAPEQIKGHPPVSHRTDLYALGCVLFELLTGRRPFEAENLVQVFTKHFNEPAPRVRSEISECPAGLDKLIRHLMEKDPDKRPWDAAAVGLMLKEIEARAAQQAALPQTHGATGVPTSVSMGGETSTVRSVIQKQRKKKKESETPIYERLWFLIGCLVLVMAVVVWSFWPLSEERLFQEAAAIMEVDDQSKWDAAYEKYLIPLQTKYPTGKYAEKVQAYIDKIEMAKTEKKIEFGRKLGRDPSTEAERLFIQAHKYEEFGDRVTAADKYRSMIQLLKERTEDRAYVNLARRQLALLETGGAQGEDRLKLVDAALDRADKLFVEGKSLEARKLWQSIETLYSSNGEMQPQVERSRARLKESGGAAGPSESSGSGSLLDRLKKASSAK